MAWKDDSGGRDLSEKCTDLMGLCLHTAHSCVQGVSSGKDKSNNRCKQIREVCSKSNIQRQEAGETRRMLLQRERG